MPGFLAESRMTGNLDRIAESDADFGEANMPEIKLKVVPRRPLTT